jgi:hypothetical protein
LSSAKRHARYQLLAVGQIVLILASLMAPIAGLAADPTASPESTTSPAATTPEPTEQPATEPTPAPTSEPSARPTPDPTPAPAAEPTTAADPVPSPETAPGPTPDASVDVPATSPAAPPPQDSPAPAPTTTGATHDYVVTFEAGTTAAARTAALTATGAEVIDTVPALRMAVIRVPDGTDIVAALRSDTAVTRVEPDRVRGTEARPDDRAYQTQWSLPRIGWDTVYGTIQPRGSAVVAILDTGVDARHRDLAGRLVAGASMVAGADPDHDPNGHGTAMAGIVAAATDNRRDIAGIGFRGVAVMPVTVLDADGLGQDSDIIEGIVWAVDHGADVINLSFSNPGYSAALQAAIDYAWAHDDVVVAATGNDGSSAPTYPAGDRGVIGVSNTDRDDVLHPTSNYGSDTFLAAPGTTITTLRVGGGTTSITGTSASSAEVAGSAALLRAIDPGASNGVIVGRLARTAAAVGARAQTGNGRLDLGLAARDSGTDAVRPAGVGATGGPFVGPYVAAAATVNATTTLNGSTGTINVAPNASITIVMSVTTNGGGTNDDWNSSRWAFGTSAPAAGSMTCVDHANHNGVATYTETFTITAPASAGNWNLYLYAYNGDACASGQGALFTRVLALDNLAPTATLDLQAASDSGSSNTDDITNAASPVFAVTFDASVIGLTAGAFSNAGTATGCVVGAPAGGPTAYTVTLTGCSNGTLILRLAAGAVTDGGSNTNAQTDGPTVTIDRVGPTVTLDLRAASDTGTSTADDLTNAASLVFDVTFDESVTGLAANDFSNAGTAAGCAFGAPVGSGTTYTVTVTGCGAGTVIARVRVSAVTDTAGNNNAQTNGPTVTVDRTAPVATLDLQAGSDSGSSSIDNITNAASLVYDVTFTESVTGLAAGDFSNAGTATGCAIGAPTGAGAAYTVTLTGCSGGTVILRLAAAGVTDAAGNANALTNGPTVTVDRTAPGVTLDLRTASDSGVSTSDDITNAANLIVDVTFTESVTGVALGDFSTTGSTATGCVIGAPAGAGAAYSTTLTTCSNGSVVLNFAANGATDTAGNTGPVSTGTITVTVDRTGPTVTINQAIGQADPTGTSPVTYTVVFNEAVSGFITGDVTVGGTSGGVKTGTVSGGPTTYSVAVTGMTTSGTIVATIAAARATDLAGNNNVASTSADNTVTWDSVAPTVTINQAVAQADPTGTSPITFTVVFSEAATGFATGDVTITGTAGGTKTATVTGGPITYSVAVTGMTTPGTVIASIGAGVATDTAGNANSASTSVDNTVSWDTVAPTATIDLQAGSDSGSSNSDDTTNAASLTFDVTFSETISGLAAPDFTNVGTATGCVVGAPAGSGASYTVTLTGCSQGTVILRLAAAGVTDTAGNPNALTNGPTVTIDRTGPSVTINQAVAQVDPTGTSPIAFTATFNEAVTGFATGDVTVGGTSGGAKTGSVSGGPTTYTVSVTGMTTSGTVAASIAAGVATDLAGNANSASTSTDNTVSWDSVAPTVTIDQAVAQADPTGTSPISFIVVFSEPVTGFATGDVTIGGTAGGSKTATVSGGPTTYSVAVTGMTTPGTVVASVAPGAAADLAGNPNAASTSTDDTVSWDDVPPTATIDLQAASDSGISNGDDITNAASLTFDVTFSEAVLGLTAGDLANVGTAAGCAIGAPAGAGAAYTVTLTGCGNGTVILRLAAGGVTDTASNPNALTDGPTVVIDRTAPTVTIDQAVSQVDPTNASPIAFTVVFSESVTGFATGDVAVGGSSGGVKTGTVSGGPATYAVAVTGMTTSGTVVASIGPGVATDTAGNANTVSTSTDDTVTWNRATHVAFVQQPTDSVYRATISPAVTVSILDASDLVVTESSASVTLTLAPAGPTLGGTATVAAVNGIATFSDLTVDAIGTYTLGASSAGLSGAVSVAFDVTPAPLTITADDRMKPYGQTVVFAGTEFSTSGLLGSDSVSSVSLASPGAAATATVLGGPYPITPSAAVGSGLSNYAISYADGTLTVTTVGLTLTADDQSKTYGQTVVFAGTEFSTSGLLNSDSVSSVSLASPGAAAAATVSGSPYPITPSAAVGSGLSNYAITYVLGSLTVGKADATIGVTGYSVPYDALPHTASGSATGVFGEDLSGDLDLSATTHTSVGTYVDPWTYTDSTGNYNDDNGTVASDISVASLTITADDRSKTYGQTVTFAGTEFTATGLLGTDDVTSVTLTSPGAAATATVAGGPYAIMPATAVGSGLSNYAITYVDGSLTVGTAGLTVTADDQAKPFGTTFVFTGTEFSTTGLLNADTVVSATLTSAGSPALAAPGTYPITISNATGSGLANYTITYVPGTMAVGNTAPTVGDASVSTAATSPVGGSVGVSDPDTGQTVTVAIASGPSNGTAVVAADGSFTYTPAGTYTGDDTFTVQGCDDHVPAACDTGTVTVSVYPVAVDDDANVTSGGGTIEVDVQSNDIGDAGPLTIVAGPAHGSASVGSIIYTPDAGYVGSDQVVYRVCSPNDATLCDDATLTITVTSAGGAPETDTLIATPMGPVPRGALPLVALVVLVMAGLVGGTAAVRRRRPVGR